MNSAPTPKMRATLLVAVFCLFAAASAAFGQDKDWRPISAEEMQAKAPVVEPDADAEAIFWEVRVDDSSADELSMRHYVRVKVFTEKGRDQFSKHDILFSKGAKIKDVDARVTKPDGTVVLLKKEDVVERDIVRANGVKVKAKTFALPGLETGSIVEYRYREVIDNAEATMRLIFQREVPIRNISYYVKPFSGTRGMYYEKFNMGETKFEKDKDGFSRATMTNVPALREEPMMLPTDEVRSWMYIYYAATAPKNVQTYWKDISDFHYGHTKDTYKLNDDVKAATAKAIEGAASDEDKLRGIYNWTKANIRNLQYAPKFSEEDWKKAIGNKSPGDVVKTGFGSGNQVDWVFGAMARAAGFDVREAFSGSRDEMTFDPRVPNAGIMVNSSSVAVNVGGKWQFYSPAAYYAPFGMLSWQEEGQTALIADEKGPVWQPIPLTAPTKSMEKRTGKFRILDDGSLEGEGRIEYTGHQAAYQKAVNRGDSASEREEWYKSSIRSKILGSAEVTDLQIQNLDDPDKPVVCTFKVKVPGFASRTGKRIFFQPNVYERGAKPLFTASTRKYDVYFNYPYSENDEIEISFPAGFALENADAPMPVKDAQGISSDEVKMGVTQDNKTLIYRRSFSFGNNGFIRFPAASYPAVKALFEAFNKTESHQLTLREAATAAK